MSDLQFHEAANIFPLMSDEESNALYDDINANGQKYAIELYEGQILDGRNRYIQCLKLGIECDTTDVTDLVDDPVAHVLSVNLHRRHLSASQKAMVGDKARELFDARAKQRQASAIKARDEKGRAVSTPGNDTISGLTARDEAGQAVGVSGTLMDRARTVRAKGVPELVKAVEDGRMSVTNAAALVEEDEETQRAYAESGEAYHPDDDETGVGLKYADAAIVCLSRIPDDDPQRQDGFQLVVDWIEENTQHVAHFQ